MATVRKPRQKLTPAQIALTEKRAKALGLRKRGMTFEQIAAALGYKDRSGAYDAVKAAMQQTLQEPADELRRLELERLDALLHAMWPAAMDGKGYAVEKCLMIMDRRSKLIGLDAPVRRIVDVITHDAIETAMRELEEEIAALEHDGDPSISE